MKGGQDAETEGERGQKRSKIVECEIPLVRLHKIRVMGRSLKSDHFCSITFSPRSTFSAPQLDRRSISRIWEKNRPPIDHTVEDRVCHRRLARAHTRNRWTVQEGDICTANGCASTIIVELRESSMRRKMRAHEPCFHPDFSDELIARDIIYLFAVAIESWIQIALLRYEIRIDLYSISLNLTQ